MNLVEIKKNDSRYERYLKTLSLIYNYDDFIELNRYKVDEVLRVLISSGESPRFYFYLGVKNGLAKMPFSAPFFLPEVLKKHSTIERFTEASELLIDYAKEKSIKRIEITLPPIFYNREEITGWMNAFFRAGFSIKIIDINYAINLDIMNCNDYPQKIQNNARKNLKIANNSDLSFSLCKNDEEKIIAYSVIAENRANKGYPLRMTLEQVMSTIQIVDSEMFLVWKDGQAVASALVYHVLKDIAQVIYWGDRPGFGNFKPINFLANELIHWYGNNGFKYLDIGPATENSVPNYGLCEFKESIGCERDLKFTVAKDL